MGYAAADRPTFYFIGVTTAQSSIMQVFPRWARHLGIDAEMRGMDFAPGAPTERFRDAVAFLKADPLSRGALVTTHKLDLFAACRDLFDDIGPHAALMEEVSCLSKPGGRLTAEAKDPISAGLALDAIVPDGHFASTEAEVFIMGAGGSAIAMTWHLMRPERGADRPRAITVSDISSTRLAHIRAIHARMARADPDSAEPVRGPAPAPVAVHYRLVGSAADNDRLLAACPAGSLVVNATGLGKDRPGSPLTDAARFPFGARIWELNYRGDLVFLAQARAQQAERALALHDGWTYFIHGWTRVIAEVFACDIPVSGPDFEAIARIAAEVTGRNGVAA